MLDVEKKRGKIKSSVKMHIFRAAYTEKHYQEIDHESGQQSSAMS